MSVADAVAYTTHLLFAGLWTGTVLFVTVGILPLGLRGDIRPAPFEFAVSRLSTVTRVSALALFVTGGHMAGNAYTVESLTGSPRGHLVLTMVALWFLLAALVEVGSARMRRGLNAEKVRTPARDGKPFLYAASVVALLLLVDAGLLAGGVVF
ncbi:CopD family protein [Halomarina rubra]|uniref:CopD family protein n=1 Tax=Halomarina rubra TaxID=2071873 RepID=A0ABD6B180_9EURY|nr:CopD family protein [Halomarina rubra]